MTHSKRRTPRVSCTAISSPPTSTSGAFGLRHDFVKVLDFGLVASRGAAAGANQLVTAAGTIPGTPAYMAPEMALGEDVDGRADIYALGCVAYYLLTGQLVFATDNAMQSLVKRLNEEPVRPSDRTELSIPEDLERLVLACLARHAVDRPAAHGLARSLAGVSVAPWTEEHGEAMVGDATAQGPASNCRTSPGSEPWNAIDALSGTQLFPRV